jgi:putative transposase
MILVDSTVHQYSSEILSILRSRVYQREKCNIDSAEVYGKSRNFTGESFWACGYFVSTVGLDEEIVREYIRHQKKEDEHYDQLKLGM